MPPRVRDAAVSLRQVSVHPGVVGGEALALVVCALWRGAALGPSFVTAWQIDRLAAFFLILLLWRQWAMHRKRVQLLRELDAAGLSNAQRELLRLPLDEGALDLAASSSRSGRRRESSRVPEDLSRGPARYVPEPLGGLRQAAAAAPTSSHLHLSGISRRGFGAGPASLAFDDSSGGLARDDGSLAGSIPEAQRPEASLAGSLQSWAAATQTRIAAAAAAASSSLGGGGGGAAYDTDPSSSGAPATPTGPYNLAAKSAVVERVAALPLGHPQVWLREGGGGSIFRHCDKAVHRTLASSPPTHPPRLPQARVLSLGAQGVEDAAGGVWRAVCEHFSGALLPALRRNAAALHACLPELLDEAFLLRNRATTRLPHVRGNAPITLDELLARQVTMGGIRAARAPGVTMGGGGGGRDLKAGLSPTRHCKFTL